MPQDWPVPHRRRLLLAIGAAPLLASAQPARVYRVGVIHFGGTYEQAIEGLRDGLRALGLAEGKQYVLHLREARDAKSVGALARGLEGEKVDVIYSVTTTASQAAKRETKTVPIVFYAGKSPAWWTSFASPGGGSRDSTAVLPT